MPKFIEEFVETFPRIQIIFRPFGKVIYAFDRFYALPTRKFFERNGRAQSFIWIALFGVRLGISPWLVCCIRIEHLSPPSLHTQCTTRPRNAD
jgi:hypothetical protein